MAIQGIKTVPRKEAYDAAVAEVARVQQEIALKTKNGAILDTNARSLYWDWLQKVHKAAGIPKFEQWELDLISK
jgi:hypothetical protein